MHLSYDILEYIQTFTNNNTIYFLNHHLYKKLVAKKKKAVSTIEQWYATHKLNIPSTTNVFTFTKGQIIRSILQNIQQDERKLFITLPEFISFKLQNEELMNKVRDLPRCNERKRSDVIKFLIQNNEVKTKEIINVLMGITRLLLSENLI